MYIVIETARQISFDGQEQKFMHFIDENKEKITDEFIDFIHHLNNFPGQQIKKVYKCKDRLTEW